MKRYKKHAQRGFSLFEVLVAMLVAGIGVAAVMTVHAGNLRHVRDHADLNRAQLILNNLVYRVQFAADSNTLDKTQIDNITTEIVGQMTDAGLRDARAAFKDDAVQIQWIAHDSAEAVVRQGCSADEANMHCLIMRVAQ